MKNPRVLLHGHFTYFALQSNPPFPKLAPMPTRTEAEEHLRVIRSLMEKATIYRALSAPTALVGGLLSILAAIAFEVYLHPILRSERETTQKWFLVMWLVVLGLTSAANTSFIWKDARRRGDPFISQGMRLALLSLLPSFACAGFATLVNPGSPYLLSPLWMVFYGLGLLATWQFAPRSIAVLGCAFLIAGLVTSLQIGDSDFVSLSGWDHLATESNRLMAATFGLFHLLYAACTWPRKTSASNPGVEP